MYITKLNMSTPYPPRVEFFPLDVTKKSGSLDIHTKSLNPPPPDVNPNRIVKPENLSFLRLERWGLLSVAREVLRPFHRKDKKGQLQKKFRVVQCMRLPIENDVQVMKKNNTAHYAGLNTCGSVWTCPVCASKITEKRRVELRGAMDRWQDQGGSVVMVTSTIPHTLHDRLDDILKDLKIARDKWRNRKGWKKSISQFGIKGTVRSLEITLGKNGWHPHIHELFFLDETYKSDQISKLKIELFLQWSSALDSAGYNNASIAAFDVQDGSAASDYVTKWGMDSELTKQQLKRAGQGYSPFDLLRSVIQDGDVSENSAGSYFVEYAFATHGKRQLYWSTGLKKLLGVDDKTDKDLCDTPEQDSEFLGSLTIEQWRQILKYDIRGEFLEYAALGGFRAAVDYLQEIEIERKGVFRKRQYFESVSG